MATGIWAILAATLSACSWRLAVFPAQTWGKHASYVDQRVPPSLQGSFPARHRNGAIALERWQEVLQQFLSVLLSPPLQERVAKMLEDPGVCATILPRFALNVARASVHLKYFRQLQTRASRARPEKRDLAARTIFDVAAPRFSVPGGDTATTGAYTTFSSGLPSPSPARKYLGEPLQLRVRFWSKRAAQEFSETEKRDAVDAVRA